ncbi:MAG: branched-chain amino acid ABC transporter permease [Candidatus Bathyarchaeia archaeon]
MLLFLPNLLPRYVIFILTTIFVWAIFAMACDIMIGYTGLLSFAHAVMFGMAGYGVAWAIVFFNLNVFISIAFGLLIALLLSLGIGFLALRARGPQFIILTFIFCVITYTILARASSVTGGIEGMNFPIPKIVIGSLEIPLYLTQPRYYFAIIFFVISYLILNRIVKSPFGRILVAIRENEERARFLGYNTLRYKFTAFFVAGIFSGLAGAVYSVVFGYASPALVNFSIATQAVLWIMFGGAGTLIGPILGCSILIPFVDYLSTLHQSYMIAVGAILIIVAFRFRRGIVGYVKKKMRTTEKAVEEG